jgi:hypothetical protein
LIDKGEENANMEKYNSVSIGVGYYMWEQGSDSEVFPNDRALY